MGFSISSLFSPFSASAKSPQSIAPALAAAPPRGLMGPRETELSEKQWEVSFFHIYKRVADGCHDKPAGLSEADYFKSVSDEIMAYATEHLGIEALKLACASVLMGSCPPARFDALEVEGAHLYDKSIALLARETRAVATIPGSYFSVDESIVGALADTLNMIVERDFFKHRRRAYLARQEAHDLNQSVFAPAADVIKKPISLGL